MLRRKQGKHLFSLKTNKVGNFRQNSLRIKFKKIGEKIGLETSGKLRCVFQGIRLPTLI